MNPDTPAVLITGATGKLGTAFTDALLNKGYTIIFTSRSAERIQNFLAERPDTKSRLYGISVDFEAQDAITTTLQALEEKNLWPIALVNNARNAAHLKMERPNHPYREGWLGEYLLDVIVPYDLSMSLSSHPASRLKSIVNVASMYGVVAPTPSLYDNHPMQSPIHYSVAKAAVIHLTKEMAVRLADREIRVNAISYGGVQGRVNETFKQRYAKLCPMGRMLEDNEVTGPLEFLVTDMSSGMTGHNLIVDGGWSIW